MNIEELYGLPLVGPTIQAAATLIPGLEDCLTAFIPQLDGYLAQEGLPFDDE